MHWVGIGLSVGGALFHGTNAVIQGFWPLPPISYLSIVFTIIFVVLMAGTALLVVCFALNDRKGLSKVRSSLPLLAWYPMLFLAVMLMTSGYITIFFYGPSIFFSCAAGHWFIAHERREDASMGQKRAAMVIVAALVASSPVLVDRALFRPMYTCGYTITRAVTGPASAEVVTSVEGFNVTAGLNWSAISAGDEYQPLYFSGSFLEIFINRTLSGSFDDIAPIQYSMLPHTRFDYSLTGGLVTGNITFTYTNHTLRCKVNGTNVVEHSTSDIYGYGSQIQMFMNASLHPVPTATPASVTLASGYLVHLEASYSHWCGGLCGNYDDWEQWYLVRPGGGIDWVVVTESWHAIS
jgi:hypothetical protein